MKLSTGRVVTGKVTQVSGSIIEFRVGNRVTFYSLSNLDPSERARFGGGAPAAKPVAQPASASAAPRSATAAPSAVESARPARSSSVSRGPADRALARALADGDAAAALAALAADAGQANGAGYHDRSGLCEVIALHMDDVAERMISMGSDVNAKGAGDKTPLHWAGRENNAKIAGRCFPVKLGRLKEGYAADVIILDYLPPTEMNANNANGHLLFGASGRNVVTTIAAGRVLMKDRKLTAIDRQEVFAKARECAKEVWKRL